RITPAGFGAARLVKAQPRRPDRQQNDPLSRKRRGDKRRSRSPRPSKRDRRFESGSLQRRVINEPERHPPACPLHQSAAIYHVARRYYENRSPYIAEVASSLDL